MKKSLRHTHHAYGHYLFTIEKEENFVRFNKNTHFSILSTRGLVSNGRWPVTRVWSLVTYNVQLPNKAVKRRTKYGIISDARTLGSNLDYSLINKIAQQSDIRIPNILIPLFDLSLYVYVYVCMQKSILPCVS